MILDKNLIVSDLQSLVTTFGTTLASDNSIDYATVGTIPGLGGSPYHDIGRGSRPILLCQITTAVTSAGAATVQFQLVMSANADLSAPTVVAETPALGKAVLVAGYRVRLAIPDGITARYIGMNYIVGTADTTAGKVTAGLAWDVQSNNPIA